MNNQKSFPLFVTRILFVCLVIHLCAFGEQTLAKTSVSDSVVKIYTVFNPYSYHHPWQLKGQKTFHGSGAIIKDNLILTNAHVVSDQVFIQVRRGSKAKKYTAHVKAVSHASDLALLTVNDKDFFKGVTPLEIGVLPDIRDKVAAYGFPDGGDKLSISEGIVSRIEHTNYAHSGAYLLTCQVDASINSGNSGGPVIQDGKIVGVAFQALNGGDFENIGYMVPAPVINHFLIDVLDGKLHGIPELGLSMQKMENDELRDFFKMGKDQTGALIVKIYPDSPAENILSPGDVILSADGIEIANDGTIPFHNELRTFFGYITQNKHIGESVTFKILRDGKTRDIVVPLTMSIGYERLVPHQQYDRQPSYFIYGGLVFESLTRNYLQEFGTEMDWYMAAPADLLNAYIKEESSDARREVVVLTEVLADELTTGFHEITNYVIDKINGRAVKDLKDLINILESDVGQYQVIEDSRGYKIILNREKTRKRSQVILDKYKISHDRSEDFRNPTLKK